VTFVAGKDKPPEENGSMFVANIELRCEHVQYSLRSCDVSTYPTFKLN